MTIEPNVHPLVEGGIIPFVKLCYRIIQLIFPLSKNWAKSWTSLCAVNFAQTLLQHYIKQAFEHTWQEREKIVDLLWVNKTYLLSQGSRHWNKPVGWKTKQQALDWLPASCVAHTETSWLHFIYFLIGSKWTFFSRIEFKDSWTFCAKFATLFYLDKTQNTCRLSSGFLFFTDEWMLRSRSA